MTNFSFKLESTKFQDIWIISGGGLSLRHGANAIHFADIDGNNDKDFFFGDFLVSNIFLFRNIGTPSNPNLILADSLFPSNDSFHSQGFAQVQLEDIDNDDDLDLFISVLHPSQSINHFTFYRNDGNKFIPYFNRITDNFLGMIDVGHYSSPFFGDLNGDGLDDLIFGSSNGKISFYKNIGFQYSSIFNFETNSLQVPFNSFNSSPALADLDNDGDCDLVLGTFDGKFHFYRNLGMIFNFNFQLEINQLSAFDIGQSSSPFFVDINNDGDFDLFSGNWNSRISFFRNIGTKSNFNFELVTNFLDSIDVGDESIPRFYDYDNDEDYDLFIGNREGKIFYYENLSYPGSLKFILRSTYFGEINLFSNCSPFFIDINNDGDADIFTGTYKGGIYFFESASITIVEEIKSKLYQNYFILFQNYPNPFFSKGGSTSGENLTTIIEFCITHSSTSSVLRSEFVTLKVYDILVREVATLINEFKTAGKHTVILDTHTSPYATLPSGVYFYKFQAGSFTSTKKFVLIN